MEVGFGDDELDRLETDPAFTSGRSSALVKAFRKRMQFIRAAASERDLYSWKSLRMEKLSGKRSHQYSIRLNSQFRLILEIAGEGSTKRLVIVSIEDYH